MTVNEKIKVEERLRKKAEKENLVKKEISDGDVREVEQRKLRWV